MREQQRQFFTAPLTEAPPWGIEPDYFDPFFDSAGLTSCESERRWSGGRLLTAAVRPGTGPRSSDGSDTITRGVH